MWNAIKELAGRAAQALGIEPPDAQDTLQEAGAVVETLGGQAQDAAQTAAEQVTSAAESAAGAASETSAETTAAVSDAVKKS